MKRKTTYGFMAMATIALLAIGSVAAFGEFGNKDMTVEEREDWQTFREDVRIAVENQDYEAWASLMESQITLEQFNAMVDKHAQMEVIREIKEEMMQAYEDGDMELVEDLKAQIQELMPQRYGGQNGFGNEFKKGFKSGFNHGDCPFAN